ncbi:mycolipanoate synthase-like [Hyperolius riggenbachi]|uniref:mycolipanoate synthase-like n=1 Tax=Hyperolius riggenbachi TaxID=752182 RepID=UPI0035A2876B
MRQDWKVVWISGEGIDNFWKVIVEGRNCTVEIPEERFNAKHWYDSDSNKPGKTYSCRAAFVDGIHVFDNKLFGIHNLESDHMDPQHKLLLECTYRALEDAGYAMESISGSNTGVFIGLMNRDAEILYPNDPENINHFIGTGTSMCIAANRLSYFFNLTGPSMSIDTACSSSLVALHCAYQAIRQGDCEMAICGGVSCIMEPRIFVSLSKAKMISPEGISKPFSKKADGYGRGEGCGIVVLKPLHKAKEDCSKVWGVICASSLNQDGRSVTPITKPSLHQQEKLLQRIYTTIDPSSIQYVEAHGTGTPVGDPIEVTSIGNIIGKRRNSGVKPLKIGSVKGNIGHTESAAGMAGLIKVLLMMHHEVIPPSLHYSKENGIKQIEDSKLIVPTAPEKWHEDNKFGRMAGINCFGFGGTNSHIVIKQHKVKYREHDSSRPVELFILSAASRQSLQLSIEDTKQAINKTPSSLSLENLVYTAACRRSHLNYKYRAAFLASSLSHLQQQLQSINTETIATKGSPPQIVFVFCGNGVLSKGMCKVLLEREPVFREKCLEIDKMFQVYTSLSVVQLLENEFDDFSSADVAQLLLFAIQVSLVGLLRHWGVNPDCIVGHSVGEVAAAHCSGILSLEDAVRVIYHRSTLQCKVTEGKMLVVGNVPVTEISNVILPFNGKLSIAAYNSPTSCTVSGDGEAIQNLNAQLLKNYSSKNIFLHALAVPTAYHSHLMDPILDEIKNKLHNLHEQKLQTALVSTVSGKPVTKGDFTTGEYWAKNIREPVAFQDAIKASANEREHIIFIEIGPRRALQRNITEILGPGTTILPALQPKYEYESLFAMMMALFKKGYNPNWNNLFSAYKSSPSPIPRYQFEHNKQDINFEKIRQGKQSLTSASHPLLQSVSGDYSEFKCTISKSVTPYVYEHKNLGSALVPGAFYVELGLAAAVTSSKPRVPLRSLNISATFLNPCILQKESQELSVKLRQQGQVTHFDILTQHVYASGTIETNNIITDSDKRIYIQHIVKRCQTVFKKEDVYELLSKYGFEYGNSYQQLCDVLYGDELKEGIGKIKVSEEVKETMYEHHIHPVILDCFLQMVVCVVGSGTKVSAAIFPSSIEGLTIFQPLQEEMIIYMKIINTTESSFELCGCFADMKGLVLAEIKSAKMKSMRQAVDAQVNVFFQMSWTQIPPIASEPDDHPSMLIYADNCGIGQQLSKYINKGLSFIHFNSWDSESQIQKLHSSEYNDVVFMWGIQGVNDVVPNNLSQHLAKCCEVYRQLILAVRQKESRASIRTVTYRTHESTVDHINPGFALVGMTRACTTELPDILFQLIDISSSSPQDEEALVQVLLHYKPSDYPEIWINEGRIYAGEIMPTDIENHRPHTTPIENSDIFTLCTSDINTMSGLSAEPANSGTVELSSKDLLIKIKKICAHTEDYFPVSLSSWRYGNTLYWNGMSPDKHKLVVLDFAGTVMAVGRDVKKIKVGNTVAACYPVVANSRIRIPETVCYQTKKFPILRETPCISLFVLAWEILHKRLPRAKNKPKLTIVTPESKSILCTLLVKAAKHRGWETVVSLGSKIKGHHCSAIIILPSTDLISRKDLSQLPHLKDVVVIYDQKNVKTFQNLTLNRKTDTHMHLLDLSVIFQRTYLQETSKDLHKWLKSLTSESPNILTKELIEPFQQSSGMDNIVSSYFNAQSLPLIELDINTMKKIPMSNHSSVLFRPHAVYIVAGGLTGLGFETVKFILRNGGSHVVILSRRSPTTEMNQEIATAQSEKENCKVITLQCNLIHYTDVKKAIESIQKHFPNLPIKGVFHSAVVLHDGILQNLNLSLFEKVLSPKVEGALNLHNATLNQKLDYFVCYSSVASFIGNPGQANYAAANSFLDIFCHYRRNIGLPAQSINWGGLNIGVLLNQHQIHELLQARGILLINEDEIHTYLKKNLLLNNSQQAIVKFDFKMMHHKRISFNPILRQRLNKLIMEYVNPGEDKSQINQSIGNAQKPEDYTLSLLSELTNVTPSDLKMSSLLTSLGIDSMLAMTLQYRLLDEKGVNIPLVRLLDPNTSISDVVSWVRESSPDKDEIQQTVL